MRQTVEKVTEPKLETFEKGYDDMKTIKEAKSTLKEKPNKRNIEKRIELS